MDGPKCGGRYLGIRCIRGHTQRFVQPNRTLRELSKETIKFVQVLRFSVNREQVRNLVEYGWLPRDHKGSRTTVLEIYPRGDVRMPVARRMPSRRVEVLLDLSQWERMSSAFLSPEQCVIWFGSIPVDFIKTITFTNAGVEELLYDRKYSQWPFVGALTTHARPGADMMASAKIGRAHV